MRTLLWTLLLSPTLLPAQRTEIVFQGGGTLTQRREIAVPGNLLPNLGTLTLREDNGYAAGIVFGTRLVGGNRASLWLQVPLFVVQATNTDLLPVVARPIFGDTSGLAGFLTPGLQVRFFPEARVTPYVLGGAGYARVIEAELTSLSPVRGRFANEGTWALTYGGGADLRLLRWLALRGELRNFYTGDTQSLELPAETRQRNTLTLTVGVGFRF